MDTVYKNVTTPLTNETLSGLRAGDRVLLSGIVYTARDAAHARMVELIEKGEQLPIDVAGQVIYYVGPTPERPGQVIGSAGPTTSGRMDKYTPALLEQGLAGMIGKGARSEKVRQEIARHNAVYFAAIGGLAALLAKKVVSCELVAWEDLGCEAIRKLTVEELPLVVINDSLGNDYYQDH